MAAFFLTGEALKAAIDMKVQEPWYSHLKSGAKTVEGKKDSPTWEKVKIGSVLRIIRDDPVKPEAFYALVKDIRTYHGPDPLLEYLDCEGWKRVLPDNRISSKTHAIAEYLKFSSVEEISKYGMKAIEISLIR